MTRISFEGRPNKFVYRDVKYRITSIIAADGKVVRVNVDAQFNEEQGEVRIKSLQSGWDNEESAIAAGHETAERIIDDHLA